MFHAIMTILSSYNSLNNSIYILQPHVVNLLYFKQNTYHQVLKIYEFKNLEFVSSALLILRVTSPGKRANSKAKIYLLSNTHLKRKQPYPRWCT